MWGRERERREGGEEKGGGEGGGGGGGQGGEGEAAAAIQHAYVSPGSKNYKVVWWTDTACL